jgi:hypothetical protein
MESYLTEPAEQPDTSQWQTEIAFPLADRHQAGRAHQLADGARGPGMASSLL